MALAEENKVLRMALQELDRVLEENNQKEQRIKELEVELKFS